MKVSITEFRDMIATAVRQTVAEAKRKPKEVAPRSEESILAQRDAQVRALPGYAHGEVLDMSKPLGKRSRTKRQGASGMGNWTSEGRRIKECGMDMGPIAPSGPSGDGDRLYAVLDVLRGAGIDGEKATEIAEMIVLRLSPPTGIRTEAIRRLVRMIVREEIRVGR